ncbi:MAG: hypothetical protein D4R68_06090 [Ignavibacteriales bacterium]|nr:MAG: hypothetical protein D4R68_06090 [Ignavibacteriales bacterium]
MKSKKNIAKIFFILFFSINFSVGKAQPQLTKNEITVLKTCEGIIQLFKKSTNNIWPGFDLSKRKFIIYFPGKWTLLFNQTSLVEGFEQYPKDWPDLGCPVLVHKGQYKDLIGQLVFDLPIDTFKTVAIGFPEEMINLLSSWVLFGNYIHEAFHQYQSEMFGEIPWEREERYPILEKENTALAYIEMKLLSDALLMMKENNKMKCRDYVERFTAIRTYRWKHSNPFVARYEQGQEIREGTPRYVETKSIQLMKTIEYKSSFSGLTTLLSEDFIPVTFPELLFDDLRQRMTEYTIRPEDMLRNRIYPVGSSIGFLLDYFNIDWKSKAQKAGTEFNFVQLLIEGLGLQKNRFDNLIKSTKSIYGYDKILAETEKVIQEYMAGYQKEFDSFESQPGYRLQIELSVKSLSRSRNSSSKNWLVENGTKSLCARYQVFTLKTDKMSLQIQNSGVWQLNDWDKKNYTTVFFSPEIESITVDGIQLEIKNDVKQSFQKIEISGNNFKLSIQQTGIISVINKKILIQLN